MRILLPSKLQVYCTYENMLHLHPGLILICQEQMQLLSHSVQRHLMLSVGSALGVQRIVNIDAVLDMSFRCFKLCRTYRNNHFHAHGIWDN